MGTGAVGVCQVAGDPHIRTFDREDQGQLHFYDEGDYWLVNSDDIKVQCRYARAKGIRNPRAWCQELAISRSGMADTIIIGEAALQKKFQFGGEQISLNSGETKVLGSFANADLKVHQEKRHGQVKTQAKYVFSLTGTSTVVEAIRSKYGLHVIISMQQPDSTDGHCGNFNGRADDDKVDKSAAVAKEESMFATIVWPEKKSFNCVGADLEAAKAACKAEYGTCEDRVEAAKQSTVRGKLALHRLTTDIASCAVDYCGTDLDVEPDCDDDGGKFVEKAHAVNGKWKLAVKNFAAKFKTVVKKVVKRVCVPKNNGLKRFASWCKSNGARGNCAQSHCKMIGGVEPIVSPTGCVPKAAQFNHFASWCKSNGAMGNCNPTYCRKSR